MGTAGGRPRQRPRSRDPTHLWTQLAAGPVRVRDTSCRSTGSGSAPVAFVLEVMDWAVRLLHAADRAGARVHECSCRLRQPSLHGLVTLKQTREYVVGHASDLIVGIVPKNAPCQLSRPQLCVVFRHSPANMRVRQAPGIIGQDAGARCYEYQSCTNCGSLHDARSRGTGKPLAG